jgi:hypothetical protein
VDAGFSVEVKLLKSGNKIEPLRKHCKKVRRLVAYAACGRFLAKV